MCVVSEHNESIITAMSIVYSKVSHLHVFDIFERMYAQASERAKTDFAMCTI